MTLPVPQVTILKESWSFFCPVVFLYDVGKNAKASESGQRAPLVYLTFRHSLDNLQRTSFASLFPLPKATPRHTGEEVPFLGVKFSHGHTSPQTVISRVRALSN